MSQVSRVSRLAALATPEGADARVAYVRAVKNLFTAKEIAPRNYPWLLEEVEAARQRQGTTGLDKNSENSERSERREETKGEVMANQAALALPATEGNSEAITTPTTTMAFGGLLTASQLVAQRGAVPFWTGQEDPRNGDAELEVIEFFRRRPNTFSVRDVRDSNIPWSIEVVGKKARDVKHVRILCEQDLSSDVVNLPFEVERIAEGGQFAQLGWGEHFDIDFLVFYAVKAKTIRLVSRSKYAELVHRNLKEGVSWERIERHIPRDPYRRVASGFLVPELDVDLGGALLELRQLHIDE